MWVWGNVLINENKYHAVPKIRLVEIVNRYKSYTKSISYSYILLIGRGFEAFEILPPRMVSYSTMRERTGVIPVFGRR